MCIVFIDPLQKTKITTIFTSKMFCDLSLDEWEMQTNADYKILISLNRPDQCQ